MHHAYIATVLDLSLPVAEDALAVGRLGDGLRSAMRILEAAPNHRVEVALAGGVTSALLRFGHERALQMLAERASAGQVSFLATAAHGAFLPLLPASEVRRQLDLSDQVNTDVLGDFVYRPEGLFPPQLGYSRNVAEIARLRGLPRIVLDDIAYHGGTVPLPRARHFSLRRAGGNLFFVDRAASELVASGRLTRAESLVQLLPRHRRGYLVLRIPSRTLYAESPSLRLLADVGMHANILPALFEELTAAFPEFEEVEPLPSALGTDPDELASGVPYAKWFAPGNELHALLWKLAQLCSEEANRAAGATGEDRLELGRVRMALDRALDCSPWRYASGKPEFDPARVKAGGRLLLEALLAGRGSVRPAILREAEGLYERLAARCDAQIPAPAAEVAAPL